MRGESHASSGGPYGPVTAAIERDYRQRTAAARERLGRATTGLRMLEFRQRGDGNRPQSTTNVEIEESYYHEIPVIRSQVTTWGGRIWVQRRGDEPESHGPIDVLTPEGEYIGTYPIGATECQTPSARTDSPRSSSLTNSTWPAWWCGGCRPRFAEPHRGTGSASVDHSKLVHGAPIASDGFPAQICISEVIQEPSQVAVTHGMKTGYDPNE